MEEKDEITQIKEGLIPMPEGFKWNEDESDYIPMTTAELYEAGLKTPPKGFKVLNGKLVELTQEEKLEAGLITQSEIDAEEIARLKEYLASTDYVTIKIAEGEATVEEYADILAERKAARKRINELGK